MKLGFSLTGSFCTISSAVAALEALAKENDIVPIVSSSVNTTDTRFGKAVDTISRVTAITGKSPILSVKDAEPLGPQAPLDAMIICPCTGNTLAKLACGITDGAVTMAAKAHLRCDRPLIIAIATNDALSQNLKNIATLLTRKSIYFVPFSQDAPKGKPYSLISDFSLLPQTLQSAMNGKQIQPILL